MRLPGATNVPDALQVPLCEILAALENLHQEVQVKSTGRATAAGFTVPEQEKELIKGAKRHQALFAVAAKTYNGCYACGYDRASCRGLVWAEPRREFKRGLR